VAGAIDDEVCYDAYRKRVFQAAAVAIIGAGLLVTSSIVLVRTSLTPPSAAHL